jgi:hypothetical protein
MSQGEVNPALADIRRLNGTASSAGDNHGAAAGVAKLPLPVTSKCTNALADRKSLDDEARHRAV